MRLKGADGHYRWLRGRGTVLARAADGRVARVLVASQDLTDVQQARRALARILSGLKVREGRVPARSPKPAAFASSKPADVQFPESWLPFVVAR